MSYIIGAAVAVVMYHLVYRGKYVLKYYAWYHKSNHLRQITPWDFYKRLIWVIEMADGVDKALGELVTRYMEGDQSLEGLISDLHHKVVCLSNERR